MLGQPLGRMDCAGTTYGPLLGFPLAGAEQGVKVHHIAAHTT